MRMPILARSSTQRALRAAQWIALSVGVALTGSYVAALASGEIGRRADIKRIELALAADNQASAASPLKDEAMPDMSLWSASRVRDFKAALGLTVDEPLAVLRIPSLGLNVPVYSTTSELHLNRGAGVIEGMAAPDRGGNLGVAGHRDGFFRVLKDITANAVIEVQTREHLHRYRVVSMDIVEKDDRRLLADTDDPTITLVTCYPFYFLGDAPRRFIVRGAYLWPSDADSHS